MAQLTLRRALRAEWVDALFEAHAEQQYTRELLFSTVVDLMALVAVGLRPSLHAAAREALVDGTLGVSLQALYDKVNHTEPAVLRALVRGSAERLGPVTAHLRGAGPAPPWLAGYRVRVLDGNHLPPSEKRVKPLRGRRGAALPGQALVLYAPEADLVVDLIAGEDAHAQEPTYVPPLVAAAGPGELWIGDRNFATRGILAALHALGAAVLVREHRRRLHPAPAGERRGVGRGATGVLYEQPVDCPGLTPGAPALRLRRIEVELDTPLESGETVLRLLTTLPAAVDAAAVAALYRRRWTVEGLFQRLEAVLHSEVRSLGQPRAALLAFSVAVVAYNVLAVVQAALEAQAAVEAQASAAAEPVPISTYYVAHTVREHYRGLVIAVAADAWAAYDRQPPAAFAASLRGIAAHVRLEAYRKHPRGAGGPRQRKGYVGSAELQHISTARVLAAHKKQRPQQAP
ncbi:MAG: transposase [Myxococcales bacterium]